MGRFLEMRREKQKSNTPQSYQRWGKRTWKNRVAPLQLDKKRRNQVAATGENG